MSRRPGLVSDAFAAAGRVMADQADRLDGCARGCCWDCGMDDLPLTQMPGKIPGVLVCFWCLELWRLSGMRLPDPGKARRQ